MGYFAASWPPIWRWFGDGLYHSFGDLRPYWGWFIIDIIGLTILSRQVLTPLEVAQTLIDQQLLHAPED